MASSFRRESFSQVLNLIGLRVPNKLIGTFLKTLLPQTFKSKSAKNILSIEGDDSHKLILLDEAVTNLDLRDLPSEQRTFVEEQRQSHPTITAMRYDLAVDYSMLTAEQVLRAILPADLAVPSSFETIGHIAHLNLKEQYEPYKYAIGQVLVDKANVRTVVNKVGSIQTKFREFRMELLAGDDDLNTEVKEHGCRYRLNYGEVYWNSKLQSEHQRLLKFFKQSDVVCDMMAGIGPFAIPAAKFVKCRILANDLNPRSYHYLRENIRLNKVQDLITPFNMDGREFIIHLVNTFASDFARSDSLSRANKQLTALSTCYFTHVIMNLPASAVEFLDVFKNRFPKEFHPLPTIHCYTFVATTKAKKLALEKLRGSNGVDENEGDEVEEQADTTPSEEKLDPREEAVSQVEEVLGASIKESILEVYNVRNVAPNKEMMCVSFVLPASIGYQDLHAASESSTASAKRKGPLDEDGSVPLCESSNKRCKVDE